MDELLEKTVNPDETLLWSGKPEKFETLDKTFKPIFTKKLIISLAIAAALTVTYILLAAKSETSVKWILLAVVWVLCALSPINIFKDSKTIGSKMSYAITDKRYIILTDTAKAVEIDKCGKVIFHTDSDGHTSLVTGLDGEKNLKANFREAAVVGPSMDIETDKCDRFIMYAIPDVKAVREALKKTSTQF